MLVLDLSKAYDRVNHNILFAKLLELASHVRILNNWYVTHAFVVRWASYISRIFSVSIGAPQGYISSPILFNAYTNG